MVAPPAPTALNRATVYETNGERVFIEVTGTGWTDASILHIRAGGVTRAVKGMTVGTTLTGAAKAVLELPRGLRPGGYPVQVSADGGMTFFPVSSSSTNLTVDACPAGQYCSSDTATNCPPGQFCPQAGVLRPLDCPLGAYAPDAGAPSCSPCPEGMHCPELGMPVARYCPPGYLCNTSLSLLSRTGSLSQLEPCPAGFICHLNAAPRLCPNGHWCPEGTTTGISFAGNFSSPQPCKDGIRCEPATFDSA